MMLPNLPVSLTPSLLQTQPSPAPAVNAGTSATDFEALAIDQMLEPMFKTVQTPHFLFGSGDEEAAWRPMMIEQIARQLANTDLLKLAEPIRRAILLMQEAASK